MVSPGVDYLGGSSGKGRPNSASVVCRSVVEGRIISQAPVRALVESARGVLAKLFFFPPQNISQFGELLKG
ncbi:hypothetical protein SK128_023937, partial [Halocaridina rubra]